MGAAITIKKILKFLSSLEKEFEFVGNDNETVNGFSSLNNYRDGTVTWIKKNGSIKSCSEGEIRLVVIKKGVESSIKNQIITENPKEIFALVLKEFWGNKTLEYGIAGDAFVSESVTLPAKITVGHHCVLNGEILIGEGTVIEDNVTIMNHVTIGKDCIIHAGSVIGKDGYAYYWDENRVPIKVEQYGGVFIGDRVEIGANTNIDRGAIDDTRIGDDTKIASQVVITHNCVVGKRIIIASGARISGSCIIGDESYLAPGCIIKNQVSIGKNCFVGMNTVIRKNMKDNTVWLSNSGKPIEMADYREFL